MHAATESTREPDHEKADQHEAKHPAEPRPSIRLLP
jgi:hypothetical protein